MKTADELTRAHTIGHNRSAKEAERAKIAADVDAFIAAGGQIDVRDSAGQPIRAIPAFMSGYSVSDMKSRSRKGAKKSHRTMAAKKSKG